MYHLAKHMSKRVGRGRYIYYLFGPVYPLGYYVDADTKNRLDKHFIVVISLCYSAGVVFLAGYISPWNFGYWLGVYFGMVVAYQFIGQQWILRKSRLRKVPTTPYMEYFRSLENGYSTKEMSYGFLGLPLSLLFFYLSFNYYAGLASLLSFLLGGVIFFAALSFLVMLFRRLVLGFGGS